MHHSIVVISAVQLQPQNVCLRAATSAYLAPISSPILPVDQALVRRACPKMVYMNAQPVV